MAEYIKRDDAIRKARFLAICFGDNYAYSNKDLTDEAQRGMEKIPSIIILHCKDCKYSKWLSDDPEDGVCNLRMRPPMQVAIDDFCSFGEQKEQEHD